MTVSPDGDMLFHASFAGEEPREFTTLQDAMVYAEDLDYPTGTIDWQGNTVVAYNAGGIDVA